MLDKLEQIIGLMAKTGSITVKRIDENDNVIYQKTDADLKFGSYLADIDLNKIDFSFLGRGQKNTKITKLKEDKFQKIMDCRSKNYSKYLIMDVFTIHDPS